jgi:hypothetical protein
MADRAFVDQIVQIGFESTATPGTAVAATRKLLTTSIESGIEAEVQTFRASGWLFPSVAIENQEWVSADISGPASYTELTPLLASLMGSVTPVQVGTLGAYDWTFEITPTGGTADVPVTMTVEQGSSARAHEFAYGLVTGLGMEITRETVELSNGMLVAGQLSDNITMTAGTATTAYSNKPIAGGHWCVRMADTQAVVGTATPLARCFGAGWSVADRWGVLWPLNCGSTGFAGHVIAEPTGEAYLNLEADATGMGLLTTLRAGDNKIVNIHATGGTIDGTALYECDITMAVKVLAPEKFADEQGVYAVKWPLQISYDPTWGKSIQVRLRNNLSAL